MVSLAWSGKGGAIWPRWAWFSTAKRPEGPSDSVLSGHRGQRLGQLCRVKAQLPLAPHMQQRNAGRASGIEHLLAHGVAFDVALAPGHLVRLEPGAGLRAVG